MFSISVYGALIISLTLLVSRIAASLGNGVLLVQTPQNLVTCAPANIQWYWSGSPLDASTNTISIAVVPDYGYRKRVNAKRDHTRLIKRRAALQSRDVAIRIAGGSEVLMSDQSWVWNSVGVPPGNYRMALTVVGDGLTGYSSAFTVTTGSDTSCLGTPSSTTEVPDATTTSTDTVNSASQAAQTSVDGTSTSTALLSSSSASSSASATSTPSLLAANADDNSSQSATHSGGKIAAAVLVPILAILAVLAFFFCCRKRNSDAAKKHRQDWSEKAFAMLHRERSDNDGNKKASHSRKISEPLNAIHTAGMAQHDGNVRGELQEARRGPPATARVVSTTETEHWVDFTGETDACPITPERLEAIARVSTDRARSTEHNLRQRDDTTSSPADQRVRSNTSVASTLPPYLRDVRSPAASFGHDHEGRPLGDRIDSEISTAEIMLVRRSQSNGSTATISGGNRATNVTRDLIRTASNRSVRRKPVPCVSITSVNDVTTALENDPFGDSSQVDTESAPATQLQTHLSMQSGRTITEDQLQEMLLSDGQTPRHSESVDAPRSVWASSTAPTSDDSALMPARSLTGPVDVGMSDAGSPYPDAAHRDAWKLSVGLAEPERGFRVSFPVEQEVISEEDEQR